MFEHILVVLLGFLVGSYSLSCNEWSNERGCSNSPVEVTCDVFNAMTTQSQLVRYYNFSIITDPTSFKCMSLNSTLTPGGPVEIEGCVPQGLDVLNIPVYSFQNETDRVSRATCFTDNCNNFNQNGEIIPPVNEAIQCYECSGQENCQSPTLVTCDFNHAFATITKLLFDYSFDASIYESNPPTTYSCYSTNTSFDINGASGIWPDLIYKGCIFDGFDACSLQLNSQNPLTQNVESCYTCETDSCNLNEMPLGYGTCYVCKNYPCLDEDVVTCDQAYANATYKVLGKMYSNVDFEVNNNFDCFSLESAYSDQGIEYLGPVPIYYKGCVNSNFDACGLQTKTNIEEDRDYCLQCEGGKCNSNVNALKENATIHVEMKV